MSFLFQDNSLDLIGWLDFDNSVAPCSKIIGVCFSFACVLSICFVSHRLGFWLNSQHFLLSLSHGDEAANTTNDVTNIGAIIDVSSRTGKKRK